MPYSSTEELPQSVRDRYSSKCQRAYMNAFNSVHEKTGDEGRAAAAGHSAAQNCEGKSMSLTDDNDREVILDQIRFDIFTREWNDDLKSWVPSSLKAYREEDGRMVMEGIASSTIRDLHGDMMLLSALEDMERSANAGLTVFGNHSYNVPEDVYGQVRRASIKQAGTVDENGDPIYDLRFSIAINDENVRATQTFKATEKGSKLGISIGAMIPEGGATRDKKSGALTISHVELLEASIVGIPANPRSWVDSAMKSFLPTKKTITTSTVAAPQLTLDTDTGDYKIEGNITDLVIGDSLSFGFGKTAEDPIETDVGPEIAGVICPDCGHGKEDGGGCQNSFHSKDVEPDVTDAKIRVIEIDTGDTGDSSSQEASSSEPAPTAEEAVDEDAAETEEVIASADEIITSAQTALASLEPEVTTMLQQLLDLTNSLNRELAASMVREREAIAEAARADRQRDEVVLLSGKLIEGTNAILNKLADQPVGRRTVFRKVKNEFEDLEGVYTRDFLAMLRSTNT